MTAPIIHYRSDYTPYPFEVHHLSLCFELKKEYTLVESQISMTRKENTATALYLDGTDLILESIAINHQPLQQHDYTLTPEGLTIHNVPAKFSLDIRTRIKPDANTALSGLYRSQDMYCTQCESNGFRNITYYPDRPDVMTLFTCKIIADAKEYPVLLSNGNLIESGSLLDGQHYAIWQDPFKKPCYLFALVAGQLALKQDYFTTQDNRSVLLEIYTSPQEIDKCDYALTALKEAMVWDEKCYGRIYDLDRYMIVATPDFNMGAMENKGLNIFNTKYVLAKPETATDHEYQQVQAVIAHEYFHNWTGNRITCRDWFQLSLKEGLTVFRDQSFTADHHSPDVKRIQDAKKMMTAQFAEDASPMAHPIRPDSYIEMNNFYTVTVYEKGAEVIRMMQTIVGSHGFRRGMDLYFKRHDGQAVTCDDFVNCIAEGSGTDLNLFKHWYEQAGTPVLHINSEYNASQKTYRLTFKQHTPPTPAQPHKKNLHIPIKLGCLNHSGQSIPLRTHHDPRFQNGIFHLREAVETIEFIEVTEPPIPSLLRDFSAPVHCHYPYTLAELSTLYAHDPNPYNRWMAGQRLTYQLIDRGVQQKLQGQAIHFDNPLIAGIQVLLHDTTLEQALIAEAIILPSEKAIAEQSERIYPDEIHAAREYCLDGISSHLKTSFYERYLKLNNEKPYRLERLDIQNRALKNTLLHYLARINHPDMATLCMTQLKKANNMTDEFAALSAFMGHPHLEPVQQALDLFYHKWSHEALVVDKWFQLQAMSYLPGTLERVKALTQHPRFDRKNPNKVYSLIGGLGANPIVFHQKDGAGYEFLAQEVMRLNAINPQVAARMVKPLISWQRMDPTRQTLMQNTLGQLKQQSLCKDVYEIVEKGLQPITK